MLYAHVSSMFFSKKTPISLKPTKGQPKHKLCLCVHAHACARTCAPRAKEGASCKTTIQFYAILFADSLPSELSL